MKQTTGLSSIESLSTGAWCARFPQVPDSPFLLFDLSKVGLRSSSFLRNIRIAFRVFSRIALLRGGQSVLICVDGKRSSVAKVMADMLVTRPEIPEDEMLAVRERLLRALAETKALNATEATHSPRVNEVL